MLVIVFLILTYVNDDNENTEPAHVISIDKFCLLECVKNSTYSTFRVNETGKNQLRIYKDRSRSVFER